MIKSKKNPHIQLLKDLLHDRDSRNKTNRFVVEGVRLVEESLSNNFDIQNSFYTGGVSERGMILIEKMRGYGIPTEEVDEAVFRSTMDTTNSQGIAVICRKPDLPVPENLDFVVIADQFRDPGNLGTLLRTAAAAGAQAIFTTRGTVDLWSPKVVRSAMGAHFHLFCKEFDWTQISSSLHNKFISQPIVFSAIAESKNVYTQFDYSLPVVFFIGNEAEGLSDEAIKLSDYEIKIPMPGKFESLNAAVAAGIILFEVVRQRTKFFDQGDHE
jgi:TrmH family RNA methyltransferase